MKRWQRPAARAGYAIGMMSMVISAALVPSHTTLAQPVRASSHPCVVMTNSGETFVRDGWFNPFGTNYGQAYPVGSVYEPLFVFTAAGGGHKYPWLATKYSWSKDAKTFYIKIRHGVKWSDGQPFTAKDVVFTMTFGTKNAALDQGVGYVPRSSSNIARIYLASSDTVAIHLRKRDVVSAPTWLYDVKMLPQHIWAKVSDPTKFANLNPVGTGPFTKVVRFNSQDYVLGKNPNYWQKGRPYVSCVESIYSAGNDAALLQMIHGDADWTGNFVPNAKQVYVSKDPAHYHYWYAAAGSPVGLFFDDTKYPFSLVPFRKAVSMAIDRTKVWKQGEYGYAPPADPIGLEAQFPKWMSPALEKQGKALVTYNPDAAKALLQANGFTWDSSGNLLDPHGDKIDFPINVISGWTDWVLSDQIIAADLKAIGINATVKLQPTYDSWSAVVMKGLQPTLLWTYSSVASPWEYFSSNLNQKSFVASGNDASTTGDWERFYSPQATSILKAWQKDPSAKHQLKYAYQAEKIFLDQFPFLPMFIGPTWFTYSTKYFTGWPTAKDPYTLGPPWQWPDDEVEMVRLKPVK